MSIRKDLDKAIRTLNESQRELEAIKCALKSKRLSPEEQENLESYLYNTACGIVDLDGTISDLMYAAAGPGRYGLRYEHGRIELAGVRLEYDERPIMVR